MPRRSAFRIEEFTKISEPATLLWLRSLRQEANGDWRITAVLRGIETKNRYPIELPFGLMPALIPGTVFNKGRPGATPDIGQLEFATVPSLRHYELVSLRDVPASVFPTGQSWNWDQKLYLYRTPEMDLYVPPIELVRHLFLHDRVLANAILRRGALAELWAPLRPGYYKELVLQFSSAMPVTILTTRFVADFAWLAVNKGGVGSWDSVARQTNELDGVRLDPPNFQNSRMRFIGFIGDCAALVLEIKELPGKRDPFGGLSYTHPSLRRDTTRRTGPASEAGDGKKGEQAENPNKDFRIENGASRVSAHPDTADIERLGDDFIGHRGRIRLRRIDDSSARSSGTGGTYGNQNDESEEAQDIAQPREVMKVSVADISTSPDLPPLSFRILEPAPPGYLGELESLIETLKRMREMVLPTTQFASALCLLPEGKAISWIGRFRRPCLIAKITPADSPPVVLLEVDHAGDLSLSALALQFGTNIDYERIERSVQIVLESLDGNGHWPSNVESIGAPVFTVSRIVRLLRVQVRADQANYQTEWAARLIDKLGLR